MEESSTQALDRIDVKILRALQAEGRLTNAELAARVNVSAATCHRRASTNYYRQAAAVDPRFPIAEDASNTHPTGEIYVSPLSYRTAGRAALFAARRTGRKS